MYIFAIQFIVLLTIIYLGMRRGGISLGVLGGLGVSIYVVVFGAQLGSPPIQVILIILTVVAASSVLDTTGGLTILVQFAERILRRNPKYITILAPLCTFMLTACIGTGHAVYALQPVIADVAYKTRIRPERPMAASAVACQMGIVASPISAAVTSLIVLATDAHNTLSIAKIVLVTFPTSLLGVLVLSLWSMGRGVSLEKDKAYIENMKDPKIREALEKGTTTLDTKISKKAKIGLTLFLFGILIIVLLSMIPSWAPHIDGKPLQPTMIVQLTMLTIGAIIMLSTGVKAKDISRSDVFRAGMVAIVSIFGIAWMSDTFMRMNQSLIVEVIQEMVEYYPLSLAVAVFAVSAFVKSQAATVAIMMPLAFKLGVPLYVIVGVLPATYAYFVFCFYPTDLAAIEFDKTGTTHMGSWLFNHSFMLPGLIGVWVATIAGFFLAKIVI